MIRGTQKHFPPSERVTFAVTRTKGRERIPYTLSVVKTRSSKQHIEVIENGAFAAPDCESRLWTPAELLVVASAHLDLPGGDVWFTDNMF